MLKPDKYKNMFIEESRLQLEDMDDAILEIINGEYDPEQIDRLFRSAHSIKGMASSISYHDVSNLSHGLEDLLGKFRESKTVIGRNEIDCIKEGIIFLHSMLNAYEENSTETFDFKDLLEKIKGLVDIETKEVQIPSKAEINLKDNVISKIEKSKNNVFKIIVKIDKNAYKPDKIAFAVISRLKMSGEIENSVPTIDCVQQGKMGHDLEILFSTQKEKEDLRSIFKSVRDINFFSINELSLLESKRDGESGLKILVDKNNLENKDKDKNDISSKPTKINYRKTDSIKIKTNVVDHLLNIVGEMIINTSTLEEINKELSSKRLKDGIMQLENLVKDMHLQIMDIRMMPLNIITDILPRIVNDITKESKKEIDIRITGGNIELDRTTLEKLADPIIHLIRNCSDHGIEQPEIRKELNKRPRGTINVSAYKENDMVIIDIKDDGKGIDMDLIKKAAIEMGLTSEYEIKTLSDTEIFSYIWRPGFSTAEKITSVSGRGVGMDAVKRKIESLGGSIVINSKKNVGTEFILKIPVTIAIINAFLIKLEDYTFAVPLNKIFFVKDVPKEEIKKDEKGNMFFIYNEEEKIPLFDLKERLKIENTLKTKDEIPIITVERYNQKVAFIVDEFIKAHDIVVKPIGIPLERLKIFSGVTVLGDGNTILILDVENL